MGVDIDLFKKAMSLYPGAVSLITTCADDGERRGITATAVCSVTAEPPSLLVCVNRSTGTGAAIEATGQFNVNLLKDESSELAMRFAGATGASGEEKFAIGHWSEDQRGLPILQEARLSFSCEVSESVATASHTVFIGTIVALSFGEPSSPLLFEQSSFHRLATL